MTKLKKYELAWRVMQVGKGLRGIIKAPSHKKAFTAAVERLGCHSSSVWLERASPAEASAINCTSEKFLENLSKSI